MNPTPSGLPTVLPSSSPTTVALHIYVDFDSTMVLQDTGNTLLIHEIGQQELLRLDRLPETSTPGQVITARKAEDMKWERVKLSIQEAADILIHPEDDVLAMTRPSLDGAEDEASNGEMDGIISYGGTREEEATSSSSSAVPAAQTRRESTSSTTRVPFDEQHGDGTAAGRSYNVQLDPGFKEFHQYCKSQNIPITIVSVGIQPLIEEMLNRYLGYDHGIKVRANKLGWNDDGSWKLIRRDTSPYGVEKGRAILEARENDLQNPQSDQILWCGDAKADFPAALRANIVMARRNTTLERLLKANSIPHQVFETFATVKDAVEAWVRDHTPEEPVEATFDENEDSSSDDVTDGTGTEEEYQEVDNDHGHGARDAGSGLTSSSSAFSSSSPSFGSSSVVRTRDP